jgi:7-keto-8-aminopelargonate synthetase-like enzyme
MSPTPVLQQIGRTYVQVGARKLSYFGGCDYFRLSTHPAITRALRAGLQQFGLNVAASRMTTGNHRLYERLEAALRRFFAVDAAVLFSSGYASNLGVAQSLAGRFTHVFLDERAHASLLDAATLLGGRQVRFGHRDPAALQRLVSRAGKKARIILVTDGLFAHNGAVAPLREYQCVLPRSAWMFVDDAHAAGVIGVNGRGSVEAENLERRNLVQTVTLSKAFGVYGGAVLGSRELQRSIFDHSRSFAGNTPLPLPLTAAALAALEWLSTHPQMRAQLRRNSDYVQCGLREDGWEEIGFPGPIVSVLPATARTAAQIRRRLLQAGIHPPLIRYPGGPATGYFRFAISSAHTREQLRCLVAALREIPRGQRL